ncbi:MAG: hypothetical protein IT236_08460 [Bacteroidia bacterium]|nr:hypothetical protein [Bacteroidia bacterium]
MKFKHYTFVVIFQLCLSLHLKSQFYNLPNEYSFSLLTERNLAQRDSSIHTGVKPYIHFFSRRYVDAIDSHRVYKFISNDPGLDAAFYKHLIRLEPKNENFKLRLDPLINFEGGLDNSQKVKSKLYTNTRGFVASGYIGNKVYFESIFSENQSVFPVYLSTITKTSLVVPGQGRWKTFKTNGYDYAFSTGMVSVQPLKNLNIQVGHGKQKIGHGYRSLLLSDNAFNYPYARITHQWFKGKLQYSNIYAVFMNLTAASVKITSATERLFQKKAASFQYLSFNATKYLNFGFFQGMIWQAGDERNRQHFTWQYFNPLIYSNLLSYGLNSKNNILIGGDSKLKLTDKLNVYAQVMADNLVDTNKLGKGWGYQAGVNYFDVGGIKNLMVQAEFNFVNETAYSKISGVSTDQSFTHYNQVLGYVPGHGQELMLLMDYKYKRWLFNMKYNYQDVPLNGKTYYLNNIYNVRIGYLINPSYNFNISVGFNYRNQNFYNFRTLNNETSYFYFGLRTSLFNFYYDL